jgi:hypothetical protein
MMSRMEPPSLDPMAMLACLRQWVAEFCDDASPAQVTDILVVFAFLVGLNVAAARPEYVEQLLYLISEEIPSASQHARSLADALVELSFRSDPYDVVAHEQLIPRGHLHRPGIPPFGDN